MVNKAIQGMIVRDHGEATWSAVKERALVELDVFVSNHRYDDGLTYRLVAAASEVLALPARDVLFHFGRYWVLTTAREGYGELLDATGTTFPEFLRNLPSFHTRIVLLMPGLRPPTFTVLEETERSLRLRYESDRAGLAPFVEGLLSGLAESYRARVEVTHVVRKDDGAPHDEFVVAWEAGDAP
jgi:hypothetical protein